MKLALLFLSLFFASPSAFALTFEVIGACSPKPVYSGSYQSSGGSVGAVSVAIFDDKKIPYAGTEQGMSSILGTPVGKEALEVINESELRSYGWCYEVNDFQPDEMPDQVKLNGSEHLKWFYAFSDYKNGQWLNYCTPAHTVKPANICKK